MRILCSIGLGFPYARETHLPLLGHKDQGPRPVKHGRIDNCESEVTIWISYLVKRQAKGQDGGNSLKVVMAKVSCTTLAIDKLPLTPA